jgi:uncharacterized protein YbgA (DUF1722 family)
MKNMKKQEFIIELGGIIGTIQTYTRNPFMNGYTKELKKAVTHNDLETTKIALDKVIGWYEEQIEKINNDEYVFNKEMHAKAYHILHEFRHSIG